MAITSVWVMALVFFVLLLLSFLSIARRPSQAGAKNQRAQKQAETRADVTAVRVAVGNLPVVLGYEVMTRDR